MARDVAGATSGPIAPAPTVTYSTQHAEPQRRLVIVFAFAFGVLNTAPKLDPMGTNKRPRPPRDGHLIPEAGPYKGSRQPSPSTDKSLYSGEQPFGIKWLGNTGLHPG